jgi:hypothetical protein
MEKVFKVGDRVILNSSMSISRAARRGDIGTVCTAGICPRVTLDRDGSVWQPNVGRLDFYTPPALLHGRQVSDGDMVYYIPSALWCVVRSDRKQISDGNWIRLESVQNDPQHFSWDVPPVVDLSKIEPPLFFVEGLPVRKGSVMFDKASEVAVTVDAVGAAQHVYVRKAQRLETQKMDRAHLSFTFPNVKPEPAKVVHVRTRWFNIYETDAAKDRVGFETYDTEEKARKGSAAYGNCLGQGYFSYQFAAPVTIKPHPQF